MPWRARFLAMGETPTSREAIGLEELARQLRASASQTDDPDYIQLFLAAAEALEVRAMAVPSQFIERQRHAGRH
jgi:hypothetical protein